MARGWIHTVYEYGLWHNELEEGERVSSHRSREEAVTHGRAYARVWRTRHVVHNEDGTIAARNNYDGEPWSPRL